MAHHVRHYVAELHAQMLKYAAHLEDVTGKEFCSELKIPESYGTEFNKMKSLAKRLDRSGLDLTRI